MLGSNYASLKNIEFNPDGSLGDCKARREINHIWFNFPAPEVFDIELKALYRDHPDWDAELAVHNYVAYLITPRSLLDAEHDNGNGFHAEVKDMFAIEAETVKWLWYPYVPFGKLTLIEGDPGIGKSWLCLAIITGITLGQGMPNQSDLAYGPCLIASAEDGLADTIKPRLSSMGADTSLVRAVDGLFTLDDDGFTWLENEILDHLPLLVVIDPLMAYLSATMDINKANQARYATARLAKLAEKYGIAVIAVRHLTKGSSLKPIYRGLGSIDFTAAARSVLLAGEDPEDKNKKGFVHIKHNLSPEGQAIGYELKDGNFYWLDSCDLTSDRILQASSEGSSTPLNDAKEFIAEMLAQGPVSAKEIFTTAKDENISSATLNRAKGLMNIATYRQGETGKKGGGKWVWQLPEKDI